MPNPNLSDPALLQWMQQISTRVANLEQQQNGGVRDPEGNIRVKWGLQSDGSYGMWFLDPAGNVEVKIGDQGDGVYGLSVAAAGAFVGVNPPEEQSVHSTLSTTSTSYVDIGGPEVTTEIGSSGRALVQLGCVIGLPSSASTQQGGVAISVDGSSTTVEPSLAASNGGAGLQITCSNVGLITGLSPGSHTFKMWYVSSFGQSIDFGNNGLVVTPY